MSGLKYGVAVPLAVKCECPRTRRSPVSMELSFWADLRELIKLDPERFGPADVVVRVYCRHCSTEVPVSVADLGLLDGSQEALQFPVGRT